MKNSFESGRQAVKIVAVLAIVTCAAALMAGSGTVLQGALMLVAMLLFAVMTGLIVLRCRCGHCGKVIFLGLWNAKVCPRCRRSLATGNKVKGKR